MKRSSKRLQILLAVTLLLYACGYVTQFIGNYAVWQKNGGMLGGTSPPFPSLSPLACLKGVLWFPYNLYCTASCAAAVAVIFLYRKLFSQDALTDSERNFDFSAKGTYGTSGWMQPREVPAVLDMVSDLSKHTGTVLGMLGGKFLCIPEKTRMNGNLAVYGASGSMKTRSFCMNRILQSAARGESLIICEKVFLLNLMSAPGSGKTTTLRRTIAALKDELRIGVMEADIDSDVDARAIAETGAKAIQLHTGGMCHLDAEMTRQGLEGLGEDGLDLVVLENVGNLVCPAEFDTGAVKNAMILSVPEGHDKPLKYPLMFQVCDVVLVNKIDVLPYFDFDMDKCREYVAMRNPQAKVIPICARTGEGMDEWTAWLKEQVSQWQA